MIQMSPLILKCIKKILMRLQIKLKVFYLLTHNKTLKNITLQANCRQDVGEALKK